MGFYCVVVFCWFLGFDDLSSTDQHSIIDLIFVLNAGDRYLDEIKDTEDFFQISLTR